MRIKMKELSNKRLWRRGMSLFLAGAMLGGVIPLREAMELVDFATNLVAHAENVNIVPAFTSLYSFAKYTSDLNDYYTAYLSGNSYDDAYGFGNDCTENPYANHQYDVITLTISSGDIYQTLSDDVTFTTLDNQTLTTCFYPLGTLADYPFGGTFQATSGNNLQFNFQDALFNYVYDTATIHVSGSSTGEVLTFTAADTRRSLSTGTVRPSLIANHVCDNPWDTTNAASLNRWKFNLKCYENESYSSNSNTYTEYTTAFAGLFGEVQSNAQVHLEITNNTKAEHSTAFTDIESDTDAGLLCNTLYGSMDVVIHTGTNTETNTGANTGYSVTATSGSAGGLVGLMGSSSSLSVWLDGDYKLDNSSAMIKGIYAGGIVGQMTDGASIAIASSGSGIPVFQIKDYSIGDASTNFAGGLYGFYSNTVTSVDVFDFRSHPSDAIGFTSTYQVVDCRVNGSVTGGLFGVANNKNSLTIQNSTSSTLSTSSTNVNTSAYHGGLIGHYQSALLDNTLVVNDVEESFSCDTNSIKAGMIAAVESSSYVKVDDFSVLLSATVDESNKNCSGVIGQAEIGDSLFDLGSVKVDMMGTTSDNTTTIHMMKAGLIGKLNTSVLRLSGKTDLSNTQIIADSSNGQLVGERDRGLVYALGTGQNDDNATLTYGSNWRFIRGTGTKTDDIGSWGEVVRPSNNLAIADLEGTGKILEFNSTAHTVTVAAPNGANGSYSVNSVSDFAKLALNYQLNTETNYTGTIRFSTANLSSAIAMSAISSANAVDMTGTGFTGFMRDDGGNITFSGSFTGTNNTITLAIGEIYGMRSSGTATASESGSGKIYRHSRNGLFASINGAIIRSFTLVANTNYNATASGYYGSIVANATGNFALSNVNVTTNASFKADGDISIISGGLIGNVGADSSANTSGSIEECTSALTAVLNRDSDGRTLECAGYVGRIQDTTGTYTFTTDSVSGSITSLDSFTNQMTGGLIAECSSYAPAGTTGQDTRDIELDGFTVNGFSIANNSNKTGSGILGYSWLNTNVTFTDLDVEGTSSVSMTGNSNANSHEFAGLVYRATGYWKVDDIDLTKLTVSDSGNTTSFGLLVNKGTNTNDSKTFGLYLELTSTNAYYIDEENVSISLGYSRSSDLIFDELVAFSASFDTNEIKNGKDSLGTMPTNTKVMNNGQGVVSIHSSGDVLVMSSNGICNTYQNITKNGGILENGEPTDWPENKYTRYYYNLDKARSDYEHELSSDGQNLLLWSVQTYAAPNIKAYFSNPFYHAATASTEAYTAITGTDFNMIGLSYYPINFSDTVTISALPNLTFYNSEIESLEKKTTTDNSSYDDYLRVTSGTDQSHAQHYMMHCGLFRNISGTVTVDGTMSFGGNIGIVNSGSGAFVCGEIKGSADSYANFTNAGQQIELKGIYVNSETTAWSENESGYAPLLVNKISSFTNFYMNGVSTPTNSSSEKYYNYSTASPEYAATSLVGNAGTQYISITFNAIKLDSRTVNYATVVTDTDILADLATFTDRYHTNYSIFKNATLMEKYDYSDVSCSGTYNYTYDEDWGTGTPHAVTYGYEVSNSLENENEEHWYISSDYYTSPHESKAADEYDFSKGFLRYVHEPFTTAADNHYHELSVNLKSTDIVRGCGTYNDPYMIENAAQLQTVAKIIADSNYAPVGLQINYNSNVSTSKWCTSDHTTYTYVKNEGYKNGSDVLATDTLRQYLCQAYYMIEGNMTLSTKYIGLGSNEDPNYAFRGVIVGKETTGENNEKICPKIINTSIQPLINHSNGSVIKRLDITVKDVAVSPASTMSKDSRFKGALISYGAVIGQIYGGDNIIDHVTVAFDNTTITLNSSKNQQLYPVGGYVGVLQAGSLIFRNMSGDIDGLGFDSTIVTDGTKTDLVKENNLKWLYVNPIIGRVCSGCVVTENSGNNAQYRPFEDGTRTYQDGSKVYWNDSEFVVLDADDDDFDILDAQYTATAVGVTMRNGTKNYSITDIVKPNSDSEKVDIGDIVYLGNSGNNSTYKTTVDFPTAQSMFMLSALTQSNLASTWFYGTNGGNQTVYYTQKLYETQVPYSKYKITRMAEYTGVGTVTDPLNSDFLKSKDDQGTGLTSVESSADENTNCPDLVPYLVKNYTTQNCHYTWTGKVNNVQTTEQRGPFYGIFCVNNEGIICDMELNGEDPVDTVWYLPDGFKGLGNLFYNNLNIKNTDANFSLCRFEGNSHIISLNMSYYGYENGFENYRPTTKGYGTGFGLFNSVKQNPSRAKTNWSSNSNFIGNFKLIGNVIADNISHSSSTGASIAYNVTNITNDSKLQEYMCAGGFVGVTSDYTRSGVDVDGKFFLNNIELLNLSVRGVKYSGGIIGRGILNNNSSYSEIHLDNCSANGLTVSAGIMAGGMIGYTKGADVNINGNTTNNDSNSSWVIDSINMLCNVNNALSTTYGAGGLIGSIVSQNLTIKNMNIGENNSDYSAFIGKKYRTYDRETELGTGKSDGAITTVTAGGLLAYNNSLLAKNLTIENCNVYNISMYGGYTGGMVGYNTVGNTNINKCSVESTQATDGNYMIAGWQYVGGLVGRNYISNSSGTGGILSVDQTTINNYTIRLYNNEKMAVGGVAGDNGDGYAKLLLKNSSVVDCYIEGMGKSDVGIGGIAGINRGYLYGYNILIDNIQLLEDNASTSGLSYQKINGTGSTHARYGYIYGNQDSKWCNVKIAGLSVQCDDDNLCMDKPWYAAPSCTSDTTREPYYLVYADYNGDCLTTTNQSTNKEFSFANNTTNVKDYNGIIVSDNAPYVTSSGYVMIDSENFLTGDGAVRSMTDTKNITYTLNGTSKTVTIPASAFANIVDDIITGTDSRRYKNTLTAADVKTYLSTYGEKLTTYNEAMDLTGEDALSQDVPVLVADDNTTSTLNALINGYLQLVTNSTEDFAASNVRFKTVIRTCSIGNDGTFSLTSDDGKASLFINTNNKFAFNNKKVDSSANTKQFSLIDVQYYNPNNASEIAYHVYLPVLVKKMLKFDFKASVLSGTEYRAADYLTSYNKVLVESLGSPITVYGTFTIKNDEITSLVNSGVSLLWNYKKRVNLNDNNNAELPADTTIAIIDPNNNRNMAYFGELPSGATYIDFEDLASDYYTNTNQNTLDKFEPQTLNDLVALSAVAWTSNAPNQYIKDGTAYSYEEEGETHTGTLTIDETGTTNSEDNSIDPDHPATIKIGNDYYRPYDSTTDKGITDFYTITATGDINESYYINFFTPSIVECSECGGDGQINNSECSHCNGTGIISPFCHYYLDAPQRLEGNILSSRNDNVPAHFVLGNIYDQNLSFSTCDDADSSEIVMSDSNRTITVTASSTITLNSTNKAKVIGILQANTDINIYHSFLIELTNTATSKKEIAGSPTINGSYHFNSVSLNDPIEESISDTVRTLGYIEVKPSLQRSIRNDLLYDNAANRQADEDNNTLTPAYANGNGSATITSEFTIAYEEAGVIAQFPIRTGNNNNIGIVASLKSNLAYDYTKTAYSAISTDHPDENHRVYYREDMDQANLKYNVPAQNETSRLDGSVSQLGVNAFNVEELGEDATPDIDTVGYFSVHNLVDLKYAETVRWTLELYCKNANGGYTKVPIQQYLQEITLNAVGDTSDIPVALSYTTNITGIKNTTENAVAYGLVFENPYSIYNYDGTGIQIKLNYGVITNTSEFQDTNGMFYSNYKVKLTARLLDADEEVISGTENCEDHIIYTNAKINPSFIE